MGEWEDLPKIINIGPSNGTHGTRGCWGCWQPGRGESEVQALGVLAKISFPLWEDESVGDMLEAKMDGKHVIGLHLRMEDDWPTTIPGKVWLQARILPLLNALAVPDCLVYVASGLPRDSDLLDWLDTQLKTHPASCRLVTKHDLLPPALLDSYSLTHHAVIDMQALTLLTHVMIGHCDSSLSFHVLLRRRIRAPKPSQNDRCWNIGGYSSSYSSSFFQRFYFSKHTEDAARSALSAP